MHGSLHSLLPHSSAIRKDCEADDIVSVTNERSDMLESGADYEVNLQNDSLEQCTTLLQFLYGEQLPSVMHASGSLNDAYICSVTHIIAARHSHCDAACMCLHAACSTDLQPMPSHSITIILAHRCMGYTYAHLVTHADIFLINHSQSSKLLLTHFLLEI